MCYSAQIRADYRKYTRHYGADIDLQEFVRLYWERQQGSRAAGQQGSKAKIAKAIDAAFADPVTPEERQVHEMVQAFNAEQAAGWTPYP